MSTDAGSAEVRQACIYRQRLGCPKPATVPEEGQQREQAHEAHTCHQKDQLPKKPEWPLKAPLSHEGPKCARTATQLSGGPVARYCEVRARTLSLEANQASLKVKRS